jgi:hypothetical protein
VTRSVGEAELNPWQQMCDDAKRTLLANTFQRRFEEGTLRTRLTFGGCDVCPGGVSHDSYGGFRCTNCGRSFQPARANRVPK